MHAKNAADLKTEVLTSSNDAIKLMVYAELSKPVFYHPKKLLLGFLTLKFRFQTLSLQIASADELPPMGREKVFIIESKLYRKEILLIIVTNFDM